MITKTHEDLAQKSVAIFSDCEKYRYYLQRTWDISKPSITYLLMNPSTADEMVNDPTLTRCQTRAMQLGYGQMIVVNVFAIRETYSEKLPEYEDLNGHIGDANDMIINAVRESDITICGWGKYKDKNIEDRAHEIIDMLNRESLGSRLHALAVNADGSPKHPLYVAYVKQPIAFTGLMPSDDKLSNDGYVAPDYQLRACLCGSHDVGAGNGSAGCYKCGKSVNGTTTETAVDNWNELNAPEMESEK